MSAPKPQHRAGKVSLWRYLKLFRADILSAQPERLYRAWMAEFRAPTIRSYLCNDPAIVEMILKERPDEFPKSERVIEGLRPLLGNSVFVTNGETWRAQRRIIDPAFDRGRLREVLPAMHAAAEAAVQRLGQSNGRSIDVEEAMSHVAADIIFRTLFSVPIENETAIELFTEFQTYQRTQPLFNLGALLRLPRWFPRFHPRATRTSAARVRQLIAAMTNARLAELQAGQAPQDLATRIMTTPDPLTGLVFSVDQMVDQVAIFLLAGHETSASALSWSLHLLATHPEIQDRCALEARDLPDNPSLADLTGLDLIRDVFRETLRLYPPVPMMVRETSCPVTLRGRHVSPGSQLVLSPWHLHRHQRIWQQPDDFLPERWKTEEGKMSARTAYLPFSAGPRVCVGAAFAMIEGPLILAYILKNFMVLPDGKAPPVPVARLTVRSGSGIGLLFLPRR